MSNNLNEPWVLAIVFGLITALIYYFFHISNIASDQKNEALKKTIMLRSFMAFVLVSLTIIISTYLVQEKSQVNVSNMPTVTGPNAPF